MFHNDMWRDIIAPDNAVGTTEKYQQWPGVTDDYDQLCFEKSCRSNPDLLMNNLAPQTRTSSIQQ